MINHIFDVCNVSPLQQYFINIKKAMMNMFHLSIFVQSLKLFSFLFKSLPFIIYVPHSYLICLFTVTPSNKYKRNFKTMKTNYSRKGCREKKIFLYDWHNIALNRSIIFGGVDCDFP